MTWGEYLDRVDRVALGLRGLGLQRGDVVAVMLTNRPEFHLADTAAMSIGATPFSLYQTLAPEQIAYQLTTPAPRSWHRAGLPGPGDANVPTFDRSARRAGRLGRGHEGVVAFDTCSPPKATRTRSSAPARPSNRRTC